MKKHKMLLKVIVALTGITLTVLILFFTPLWGTAILLSFLCGMCCYVLLAATGAVKDRAVLIVSMLCAVGMPWLWYSGTQAFSLPFAALTLLTAIFLIDVFRNRLGNSKTQSFVFLSAFLFLAFFSMLIPILGGEHGRQLVLIPFIASWSADTGAQLFGRCFGKRKLAPEISPNKTVAGLWGGLLFGVVGMAVYAAVICIMKRPVHWLSLLLFGLAGAAFGTVGDLFFSYIKREHGIKDFGALMPEHGGVMDRFDSFVFAVPLFYAYMTVFPVS